MNSIIRSLLISLVSILLVAGCSNHSIPTAPPGDNVTPENTQGSNALSSDSAQNQHFCLLYNLIYIDVSNPDDPQYEVVAVRTGSIHLNILKFLEVAPCTNCFKLVGFNFPQPGYLNFDIQIKHPFPNTNLDLSVFDLRGIIMFNGTDVLPGSGKRISNPFAGDGAILNADGYTSLFNASTLSAPVGDFFKYFQGKLATPAVPNADVNAYLRFVTNNPSNNRNAFYAGDSVTRTYSMKMPTPTFVLGYAVDANWDIPTDTPVDDPITDFPITANCPEDWKIVITETPVGDGLTECGGETKLTIDIYDWQGKDSFYPVQIECPELVDAPLEATWVSDSSTYTRYEINLSNENLAPAGAYPCLIWHEAAENDPVGTPWQDLTAYQIYVFDVNPKVDQIPTAFAVPDKTTTGVGQSVQFDASDSVDNDCNGQSIVSYEWQWDSGGPFVVGTPIISHDWNVQGEHKVQLRVTDDEGSTDYLDNKINITVTDNQCPTAWAYADPNPQSVNIPVNFDASDSWDSDGTIVGYEWDWDNDGIYDELGITTQHVWDTTGSYYVQLRVTDNEGCADTLDSPLEITITVTGNQCPTAIAVFNPDPQYINQPVSFSDNESFDPDGTITSYEWDWNNDGQYDESDMYTEHSWDTPGTYYVQFRVVDDDLCPDELDSPLEVHITTINNECPTALADVESNTKYAGYPVSFYDDGSFDPDGFILSYEWDWDLDGVYDDSGQNVEHTFAAEGTYFVQFRVVDDQGCPDELDQPIQVVVEPYFQQNPFAYAAADPNPQQVGQAIHLYDNGSYDPDGGLITKYEWDFDADGTYEEENSETWFQSGTAGDYLVQLRVTDDESQTDLLDSPLVLHFIGGGDPPVAIAQVTPLSQQECGEIMFEDDGSYDPDGGLIQNYEWDLNNDGIFEYSGGGTHTTVMTEVGVHPIQFRVTDDEGMTDTLDTPIQVTITNVMPTAVASSDRYYAIPNEVITLDGSASYDGLCGGNEIVEWQWDVNNDGYFDYSGETVNFSYSSPGTRMVQLYVADDEGSLDVLDAPLVITVDFEVNLQDVTPPWLDHAAIDVAIAGNFAYFACEWEGIEIMNISNPSDPHWVNRILVGDNYDRGLKISGNYLYVAASDSLEIYDLAAPDAPALIKNVPVPGGYGNGVDVQGGYAYIADSWLGLVVIDVEPVATASVVRVTDDGSTSAVAVQGNYAFTANGSASMSIYDISTPSLANRYATIVMPDAAVDIAVSGGYAYVADWYGDIQIVDVDPAEFATIVHSVSTPGYVSGIAINGNYAYAIDVQEGLKVIDITTPTSAYVIGSSGYSDLQALAVQGNVVVSTFLDTVLYNVSNPSSPYPTKWLETTKYSKKTEYRNGYAFCIVSWGTDRLSSVDVDPPNLAHWVDSVPIGSSAGLKDLSIYGNYAFVAAADDGLLAVDISNPEDIAIAAVLPANDSAVSVATQGGYAFVADDTAGLSIYDIDPILDFANVKNVPLAGEAISVDVVGDYAYVASYDQGLYIIDINPVASASVVKLVPMSYAIHVDVSNGYAYVTGNNVSIIDVVPPESASIVGSVTYGGFLNDIQASGGFAYMAASGFGMVIADIHPIAGASVTQIFKTYGGTPDAQGIDVSGNYAYLADNGGGLRIIQLY